MKWTTKTRKEILAAVSRGHTPETAAALLGVSEDALRTRLQDPDFQAEIDAAKLHWHTKNAANQIEVLANSHPPLKRFLSSFARNLRHRGALGPEREESLVLGFLKGAPYSVHELLDESDFQFFTADHLTGILSRLIVKGQVEIRHVQKKCRNFRTKTVPVYFFRK